MRRRSGCSGAAWLTLTIVTAYSAVSAARPWGAAFGAEMQVGVHDRLTLDFGEGDPPTRSNEAPVFSLRLAGEPLLHVGGSTIALGVEVTRPFGLATNWPYNFAVRARYSRDVMSVGRHVLRLDALAAVNPLWDDVPQLRFAAGPALAIDNRFELFLHALYHARQLRSGGQAEPSDWMESIAVAVGGRLLVP